MHTIFFSLTQQTTHATSSVAKRTMAPSTQSLKVIEKFRAPAALYVPSTTKGGGWSEASRPGMGGEAIIQVQDDATMSGKSVSVVRFQLRHGKDVLNARIEGGLPINRKDEKAVLFKSASTSTSGIRKKTIYNLIFTNVEDTDEFLMWWYAKNGSIKAWLAKDITTKTSLKRKATEPTKCGFAPLQKKSKASIPEEEASVTTKVKVRLQSQYDKKPLGESTNRKAIDETRNPLALSTKMRRFENNENERPENAYGSNLKTSDNNNKKGSPAFVNNDDSHNDGSNSNGSDDNNEREEVEIDHDDAPQSQDWMSAFAFDAY
jgi:hypothetical protein